MQKRFICSSKKMYSTSYIYKYIKYFLAFKSNFFITAPIKVSGKQVHPLLLYSYIFNMQPNKSLQPSMSITKVQALPVIKILLNYFTYYGYKGHRNWLLHPWELELFARNVCWSLEDDQTLDAFCPKT